MILDWQAILKWGLLAIAAVLALRFVSSTLTTVFDAGQGYWQGPQANGVVTLYATGVYPNYAMSGRNRDRGRERGISWQRGQQGSAWQGRG